MLIGWLLWQSSYLVQGQTSLSDWTTPLNLSQSGTATQPIVVMDANQKLHILWQDMLDDTFIYTQGNGGQWSQPIELELPFGTRIGFPDLSEDDPTPLYMPQLVADETGLIHAFWLDDETRLFYSHTEAETFSDFATWTSRQSLAEGVVKMAVTVGRNGRLHLIYITSANTPEAPAGLYYRQSDDGGNTWSDSTQLYQSVYFRLLTPDLANLQIIEDSQKIYVVWDDQPFERIFLIHSLDNGTSWNTPSEIDKRQEGDGLEAVGPGHIQIGLQNGQVHLTWQAGHDGIDCNQYHQWSSDSGQTWQTSQSLVAAFPNCPEDVQFLSGSTNLFLSIKTEASAYLLVWDEDEWLIPQEQSELMTFVDEDTYRLVNYSCGQMVFAENTQIFAISCGVGTGQDIWFTTRSLTSFVEDLSVTPIWSAPISLAGDAEFVLSPLLIADTENRLHLFWQQAEATLQSVTNTKSFYYVRWDGASWSRKSTILTSPRGTAEQLTLALDPNNGNLLAAWSSGTAGEIYFSQAAADQALIGSAWSDPISLPVPRTAAAAPSLVVEENGMFHVVYAVTLNEDRGVYIVSSEDRGVNWSAPKRIFDGVEAGWEMVDEPKFVMTDQNNWHLLWLRRSLSVGEATLYYAHSEDKGQSWSAPELVQSNSQQTAVIIWHQMVRTGERTVHRSWQEQSNNRVTLWHQQSLDNGLNWSQPLRVTEATTINSPQITLDVIGRVYLTTITREDETISERALATLQQWLWQDGRWQANDSLDLRILPVLRSSTLAATTTNNGHFAVAYVGRATEEALPNLLLFTDRTLIFPEATPTPLPTLTSTPLPLATATAIPTPKPTPTIEFPTQASGSGLSLPFIGTVTGNRIIVIGALLAIIPVILVTALVLVLRAYSNRH